jgi:hypothetical protein
MCARAACGKSSNGKNHTMSHLMVAGDWCAHRWEVMTLATVINKLDTPRLERCTMHSCRHACASRQVQRGIDLYVVSKWMGHRDIKTTQRYARLAPSNFTKAVAVLMPQVTDASNDQSGQLVRKLLGLAPGDPLPDMAALA